MDPEDPDVALLMHDLRNELTVIMSSIENLALANADCAFDEPGGDDRRR